MVAVVEPLQGRSLVWDEHEHILDAVLRGDERQAEKLSLLHIQEAAQRVMQSLPETPAGG